MSEDNRYWPAHSLKGASRNVLKYLRDSEVEFSEKDIQKIVQTSNLYVAATYPDATSYEKLKKAAVDEAYEAARELRKNDEKINNWARWNIYPLTSPAPTNPTAKHNAKHEIISPPNLADMVSLFLLPRNVREAVMGDLQEDYLTNIVPKMTTRNARLWYWWQTIRTVWEYNGLMARFIKIVETLRKSGS